MPIKGTTINSKIHKTLKQLKKHEFIPYTITQINLADNEQDKKPGVRAHVLWVHFYKPKSRGNWTTASPVPSVAARREGCLVRAAHAAFQVKEMCPLLSKDYHRCVQLLVY